MLKFKIGLWKFKRVFVFNKCINQCIIRRTSYFLQAQFWKHPALLNVIFSSTTINTDRLIGASKLLKAAVYFNMFLIFLFFLVQNSI